MEYEEKKTIRWQRGANYHMQEHYVYFNAIWVCSRQRAECSVQLAAVKLTNNFESNNDKIIICNAQHTQKTIYSSQTFTNWITCKQRTVALAQLCGDNNDERIANTYYCLARTMYWLRIVITSFLFFFWSNWVYRRSFECKFRCNFYPFAVGSTKINSS